jgi:hypothetical protein
MKLRGLHYLLVFVSFISVVSLACAALTSSPTAEPKLTAEPKPTEAAPTPVVDTAVTSLPTESGAGTAVGSGTPVTFTDQNKFYQIDVPGDWSHTTSSGEHYYIDTFTSPEKGAVIESIVYDDGTPFTGKDNGRFALQLLNQEYSQTGAEGDIRISEEKMQADGSDRLVWTSKSGGYSGISFFEIRDKTTFLMFTVDWGDNYKDQYLDTLNGVIASYRVP